MIRRRMRQCADYKCSYSIHQEKLVAVMASGVCRHFPLRVRDSEPFVSCANQADRVRRGQWREQQAKA
jgi:hypothetical protein